MVADITASDDKKSTVRVGVSPVIDEKENATLRNMPKELLNEYFDAFIGMTKQASSKYNITFADCKKYRPSLCTSCERLFAYGNIQKR